MAKKALSKSTAAKSRSKQPTVKKTARAAAPKSTSKYDQTGAPWWKKFRPTEAAESKR
ncbi:MAG TPA: hypothetical protein VF515_10470 [Candidatus Binatia bacterium]|jgi:hypothetical protein